ncbi:MAG: carbamoyltransferase HypF [Rhodospirillales bacterium]|nr:carbamoyltransferase HypF [Rhodospirillales bacterium]
MRPGRFRPEAARRDNALKPGSPVAREYEIGGRVQGVGFRPFVYRLAVAHGLSGWVRNRAGAVAVVVEGDPDAVARFAAALIAEAPPLARPTLAASRPIAALVGGTAGRGFVILPSIDGEAREAVVPPDHFACDDCLDELRDPAQRRYRYPFINCTQCGPRYTLIERLPYDRPNTAMAGFALCPDCQREYDNPADRRHHAQPLACPSCGPRLSFRRRMAAPGLRPGSPASAECEAAGEEALAACVASLRAGLTVAVKGIGGYHLMCDAANEGAVARLRASKHRPHKPLAVMVGEEGRDRLDAARRIVRLGPVESGMLVDPIRPIVLAAKRRNAPLAAGVAPGLSEIGVMLAYSPLHHLLLGDFGGPLVATSGNISGEPVLTDPDEAEARLGRIADAFLHHDRPIRRPADDPVCRAIAGRARPLRLGRGSAPLNMRLPVRLARPLLAVGGQQKVTVALGWNERAVVSPHIGDLASPRGLAVFRQVIADLQGLYGVAAERVVADAHRGYAGARWARRCGLPLTTVFHHHAHASALAGEHGIRTPMLVFAWDGVGYGVDGTLWGGEALLGRPGAWQRVASFRPFALPGGEAAGREPWRSALALCWQTGAEWPRGGALACDDLRHAWRRRLNAPETSAVGRLFDAAAALTGVAETASFEGQGPMWLEAVSRDGAPPVNLPLDLGCDGVWRSDWAPLLCVLLDDALGQGERGSIFHASLAAALVDQARRVREQHGVAIVGLTGGCFQNRLLTQAALRGLEADGFRVLLAEAVPANDAGLSFGQIVEAAGADPS